jgi:RNA polymerase sigma factor (sigma-70 family)
VFAVTTSDQQVELLYAWRGGDRRAGDELMRVYYPQVLGFFRLRVADAAEDLTQRTFLACTEGRDRVQASSFRGYVFGAARKLLYKHLASTQRREKLADFHVAQPQSLLTPSRVVALRQEHWLLLRALQRISLDQQVVLALHYVQCLRAREIAEAMDVPVSTVTTRLARARLALKVQVETLKAPKLVRETLAADLDAWTRSLGPLAHALPDSH